MHEPFATCVEREYPSRAVVIACGLPATNKTFSMEVVARLKGYPVLRTDAIRRELLETEEFFDERVASSFEQRSRVYKEMFRKAEATLDSGQGVILDATFVTQALRERAAELAVRHGIPLVIQENRCSEQHSLEIIRTRMREESDSNAVSRQAYRNNKELFEPVDIRALATRFPGLTITHVVVNSDSEKAEEWQVVDRSQECIQPPT
jgi:predicted kinase